VRTDREGRVMKYPSYEDFLKFESFQTKYVVDQPDAGTFRARPRGVLGLEYVGHPSVVGIMEVRTQADQLTRTPFFKDAKRPIYLSSVQDFAYKLMCGLIQKGQL
jgi:hypothetical protein